MISFITENGADFEETELIGGFSAASNAQTFDDYFESAAHELTMSTRGGMDIKSDINAFLKNPAAIEQFKTDLLQGIVEECASKGEDLGTLSNLAEQCEQLYDNTVNDLILESTRVGTLLPIKAIDLPLVVKSHIKATSNLVLSSKVTKSPVVKKQIERTWVVDPKTKKRYQYPQCLFNDDWKEIWSAGKGLPIDNKPVNLPLFNFDIIDELSEAAVPDRENITIDIQITAAYLEDGTKVSLKKPITVNLADGAWTNGTIKQTVKNTSNEDVEVNDVLSGIVNFQTNTCTCTSASGQIKAVSFSGYLSNEKNERTVTFDYDREDREWKIEDGFRVDAAYSLEQLQDYKALVDEDLYKKTYNNLNDLLYQTEDNKSFEFLDEMFEKYDGVELDALDFNPFVSHDMFDCDSTVATVAMPSEYISNMLKFRIDRFLIGIADKAKMEDIIFVIYGNPRYVSLLDPNVNWVVRNGDMVGGVKLNYSYGIMTSGDIKIQVVSVMKLDAKKYNKLRFVAYPTNNETITFEHYKFATHIATAQNSAYRSADLPGGSQTYLMGTSRYTNICLQGIQADMGFENAEFINMA